MSNCIAVHCSAAVSDLKLMIVWFCSELIKRELRENKKEIKE